MIVNYTRAVIANYTTDCVVASQVSLVPCFNVATYVTTPFSMQVEFFIVFTKLI